MTIFQYLQLLDEHLSSGVTVGTIRRLRANSPTAADRRLSGTRAVCGVSTVSCCTRVCPYSVSYRVVVRACVRCGMEWCGVVWCGTVRCGTVRCGAVPSGARVRRPYGPSPVGVSVKRSSVVSTVGRHGVRLEILLNDN